MSIKLPKTLYHGSSHRIKTLKPMPSKVLDGEKAVFGTNLKVIAAAFIPKWSDMDFDMGYHNGRMHLIERYPNAFDKLKGVSGFIYSMSSNGFESDARLGMKAHEFINRQPVPITKVQKINDVFKFLSKHTDQMKLITYSQVLDTLAEAGVL